MRLLYIDCPFGISEDRLISGLIAAGAIIPEILEALAAADLPDVRIETAPAVSRGIAGTHARIAIAESPPPLNLENFESFADRLPVREVIRETLNHTVSRLRDAGAGDEDCSARGLVTLAAVAAAIDRLEAEEIALSPIGFGQGTLPGNAELNPSPLVASLMAGYSVFSTGCPAPLITPIAAAFVTAGPLCSGSSTIMPPMRLLASGCGIGENQWPIPDVLHLFIGERESVRETERVAVIETNIDDMTPQALGHVMQVLLELGALDVYFTPIQMKKDRPAVMVSVICADGRLETCIDALLRETTTLGVRISYASRRCLARRFIHVSTPYGEVSVKVALFDGRVRSVAPEYDDCHRLALAARVPMREVQDAATAGAWESLNSAS